MEAIKKNGPPSSLPMLKTTAEPKQAHSAPTKPETYPHQRVNSGAAKILLALAKAAMLQEVFLFLRRTHSSAFRAADLIHRSSMSGLLIEAGASVPLAVHT
jgi:hypothetical protein